MTGADALLRGVLDRLRERAVLWWLSARDNIPDALAPVERTITLGRMPPDRMRVFAAQLLGVEELGAAIWRVLSRSAEGNPLYVETIVGTLLRDNRIVTEDGVARLRDPGEAVPPPPGLDALLAERIDDLAPELRGLLGDDDV